jgi:L,D-transpeptidase YcbB
MSPAATACTLATLLGAAALVHPSWAQGGGNRGAPISSPAAATATEPTFDSGTVDRLRQALSTYSELHARGGWPTLPPKAKLTPGAKGNDVALLRRRLVLAQDLSLEKDKGDTYDKDVIEAVKRFQARHGLEINGAIGPQTLAAMNVPVEKRIRQLKGSLDRLRAFDFTFAHRYVVLNIPAATVEAVADGRVERSSIVVVGSREHESPELTSAITQVILNPTWTVPLSITKNEIIPKLRRDPRYLTRMHMRVFAGEQEVSPGKIDWTSDRAPNFNIRQDSGVWNALGAVKIDMPNRHAVYLHDTNNKNAFDAKYRFLSHGCARVKDVRDLATWVLQEVPGWDRVALDAAIAAGARREVKLRRRIPIAWIYLTGWMKRDGTIQFRNDVYGRDEDVDLGPGVLPEARPAAAGGAIPRGRAQSSHLDSR